MKIKTEIMHSIFIVTCDGPNLDAALAQEFLLAMKGFIMKSQMDILLDFSKVEYIDSTGLIAIIRSLRKMNMQRQLILCGVNERILGLLKMTQLDKNFTQSASRNEIFSNLFWAKKNPSKITAQYKPTPLASTNEVASNESTIEEDMYAILLEVDDEDIQGKKYLEYTADEEDLTLLYKEEDDTGEIASKEERRKYRRVEHKQIMDEKITVYCKNIVTGRRHRAVILNISPGGLLMTTLSGLSLGDKILLEGRLGKYFKFKEYAVSRSCRENNYGLEFVDLSDNTIHFLDQLTGSVDMIKANRLRYDQAN